MRKVFQILVFGLIILGLVMAFRYRFRIFDGITELLPDETSAIPGVLSGDAGVNFSVIASGLVVPWEIVHLPNGEMLVTERSGHLLHIVADGSMHEVAGVELADGAGLLGMTLHPDFAENEYLYLYMATRTEDGLSDRVVRFRYHDDVLSERTTIIQNIPGSGEDGGRIAFGPDGKLYITTSATDNPFLAQDRNSLAGKILRVNDDGTVPKNNPFGNHVWSYGHRNPQGLAWDSRGNLWSTENGPPGLISGFDEINRIEGGANYGWPVVKGDEMAEGMTPPILHSGAKEAWAPGSATFVGGDLLFTGLRGKALYQFLYDNATGDTAIVAHFRDEFGRLRAVEGTPDGKLLLLTNNRDGLGSAISEDDRIISVSPSFLTPSKSLLMHFR